jgi:hypothetical protein
VVSDAANHALYFYDANNDFSQYRTLGHPPDPSGGLGYLDRPTALAQHPQDGGDLAGQLWIADTGNGRVQHWTTEGTTLWMTDVTAPGPPGAPVNTGLPVVTGAPFAGESLTCGTGTWSGGPTGYVRQWRRDGAAIAGATGATYVVVAADVYHQLTCLVSATNAAGSSAAAESEAVLVPGPDSPPVNVTAPVVSGTPTVGQLLTCDPGEWSGAPTSYYYGWRRDSELRPGTNATTYLVTSDDVAHDVSCRVTATNAHGTSAAATSAARAVVAGNEIPILPPHNTVPPWITGVAETGQVLFCHPGEWTNGPTFSYVWKVNNILTGVTAETYTVQPGDAGKSVRCSVTGTNPAGVSAVPSDEVYPVQSPAAACAGGPKVVIEKGAVWARSRKVRLQVLLPEGATALQVANRASFADAQRRVLVASCGYRWRLPGGVSRATVHVRFPGAADPAAAVTDSIRIDTHVPKVTRADAHWSNSRRAWVLTVLGTDRGSGLRTMEYAKAKGSGVLSIGYGKQVVTPDQTQIQWIRLLDRAGNKSAWVRVLFTG